jgi:hypothetical protein
VSSACSGTCTFHLQWNIFFMFSVRMLKFFPHSLRHFILPLIESFSSRGRNAISIVLRHASNIVANSFCRICTANVSVRFREYLCYFIVLRYRPGSPRIVWPLGHTIREQQFFIGANQLVVLRPLVHQLYTKQTQFFDVGQSRPSQFLFAMTL